MDEYFASLARQLGGRAARATLSERLVSNRALRTYLLDLFQKGLGQPGSFLGQPVFEALFEYESQAKTVSDLGILHPTLIKLLDEPPKEHRDRQFPKTRRPYKHQVASWTSLKREPETSVIVSTGTASGKTECFLIPILDDLVREYEEMGRRPLSGVRALFLYPLNALINSQQERLSAWTAGLKGGVRFCLYNGATQRRVPQATEESHPEQVLSRKTLHNSPPPMLVTNATMLEYMLVRNEDKPILDQSAGKLRWIVLDEAHTYLGSNAAEISLLLRRVMDSFQVEPNKVRFIATSATIGSGSSEKVLTELREFLADLAGISIAQVDVITGRRITPELEKTSATLSLPTLKELNTMSSFSDRYDRLRSVPEIHSLRHSLTAKALNLEQIAEQLGVKGSQADTFAILDACSEKPPEELEIKEALLPLRGHFFMRTQQGVWACWNKTCSGRTGDLCDDSWRFGAVFLNPRKTCEYCNSLVFEVVTCNDCGEVYLSGREDQNNSLLPLSWFEKKSFDQFELEQLNTDVEDGDENEDEEKVSVTYAQRQLICSTTLSDLTDAPAYYDLDTGELIRNSDSVHSFAVASREEDRGRLQCITCGEKDAIRPPQFFPMRVGAPFYLGVAMPILLEHAPPIRDQNKLRPFQGRQMISFTDSRQGTARFASRMQIEAERNYLRSFIYHKLWASVKVPKQEEIEKLRFQLQKLKADPDFASLVSNMERQLAEKESALVSPHASLSWNELVANLSNEAPIAQFIPDATKLRYTKALTKPTDVAKMFLFREFARRPRSGSSFETLGLGSLNFPAIDLVEAPMTWKNRGGTDESWRHYLKICIDFFIRASYCVAIPNDYLRWMGIRFRTKFLSPPHATNVPYGTKSWPSVRAARQANQRLIAMIRIAMDLKESSPSDQVVVDELLESAWRSLVAADIFDQSVNGFQLKLDKSEVRIVSDAFKCPVTQRVIDVALNQVSPYHNDRTLRMLGKAEKLVMPRLPFVFGCGKDGIPVTRLDIDKWLETDPLVIEVRKLGVWTEYSERIAQFSNFFETAEHSGQLAKSRLQSLESRFKEGKTNLLSCSTTMEMGIDIGGLTVVAMNNAPPGPANWLQRAGRAGRREISQASTLTLCQSLPHGQAIFANTLWPFTTPIHVPKVALNSSRIVQRHIQAFLLGRFFATSGSDNATSLTSGWMFVAEKAKRSRCDKFIAWLRGKAETDERVCAGISSIVRRTILESEPIRLLLELAGQAMDSINEKWLNEYDALRALLELSSPAQEVPRSGPPEQIAFQYQLKRHEEEYLLRELVGSGFLPTHGFPLHVLPFVNTSVDSIDEEKKRRDQTDSSDRVDNLFQMRSYPSRQLPMAIREYAPGNVVVIDGLSYRSSGLTLHWKLPPSDEDLKETQAILGYFFCKRCGFSKTSMIKPSCCESCGNSEIWWEKYIQPSGFAVDIRTGAPNADTEEQVFVPATDPRLTCRGSWIALPNPALGTFRYDSSGLIFHHSRGATNFGYAVCLRCGRAASEVGPADKGALIPFQKNGPHSRLRSGMKADSSHICPGNDSTFAIQRNLLLGGEEFTDVFQLRLTHVSIERRLSKTEACSIAIALRLALARKIGVEHREIGWAVQENRESGVEFRDIYLFDTAAGGAGYVESAGQLIEGLFHDARAILQCTCKCDLACHACLLDFDTQNHAEFLDRNAALAWLNDEFFSQLRVPDEFRIFGEQTRYESQAVLEGVLCELRAPGLRNICVVAAGTEGQWDLATWPMWRHLTSISDKSNAIGASIVVPSSVLKKLSWPTLNTLVSTAAGRNINLMEVEDKAIQAKTGLIATEIQNESGRIQRWGVFDGETLSPGMNWGHPGAHSPIVRNDSEASTLIGSLRQVTVNEVAAMKPNQCTVVLISNELNGPIVDIGTQFWERLSLVSEWLAECLAIGRPTKIEYSDRYIKSPLAARAIYELLRPFAMETDTVGRAHLELSTTASDELRPGKNVHNNWQSSLDQESVLKELLSRGFDVQVRVLLDASKLPHARTLKLSWGNGRSIRMILDQGVGFIRTCGYENHPFNQTPKSQANHLRKSSFTVGQTETSVPVYVMRGEEQNGHQ